MFKLDTSILLDHMTWPQVEKKIEEGWTNALIGIGSTEQHGPHLPIFTDAFCGDVIGNEVAKRLGNTFQLPTIRVGCSDAHLGFVGTMSISQNTLKSLITEYCESLSKSGFKRFILVPTHGGNFKPVSEIKGENIVSYTDLDELMREFHKATEKFGVTPEDGGLHAGEIETSIMLHISEEWVQKEEIGPGATKLPTIEEVYTKGTKELSANGVLGNPTTSTAEKGKVYLEAYINCVVNYLKTHLKI
jgi:creatinine amidohydrolase